MSFIACIVIAIKINFKVTPLHQVITQKVRESVPVGNVEDVKLTIEVHQEAESRGINQVVKVLVNLYFLCLLST